MYDVKANVGSLHQNGDIPSNSKPLRYKPKEEDEEKVDDLQDSDEDMEDYSEESEEDEGSLYVQSEATSDLGGEEFDEDKVLMELPPKDPCKFLVLLPRELRDKVCTPRGPICIRAHTLTICLRI